MFVHSDVPLHCVLFSSNCVEIESEWTLCGSMQSYWLKLIHFFLDKRRKIFLVGPPSTPAPSDVNYIGTSTKYIQHMGNIAKSARKGQDCVTTNVFGWFYNISWKIIDKIHIFAQIEMMLMFLLFLGWRSNETITRFLVGNVNTWSHTSQVNIDIEKKFL